MLKSHFPINCQHDFATPFRNPVCVIRIEDLCQIEPTRQAVENDHHQPNCFPTPKPMHRPTMSLGNVSRNRAVSLTRGGSRQKYLKGWSRTHRRGRRGRLDVPMADKSTEADFPCRSGQGCGLGVDGSRSGLTFLKKQGLRELCD